MRGQHLGGITLLAFWLAGHSAWAQFGGVIQGTIKDATGAVIPGAAITLLNNESQRKLQTPSGAEGFYRFGGLAPGRYTLEASAKGMRTTKVENVELAGEATQGVDIALEASMVAETITVNGEAAPALHTETGNVVTELNSQAVTTLPQIGRDPYELLRLAPGVFGDAARSGAGGSVGLPNASGPGGSNSSLFQTENQMPIVANGQRTSQNNYEVDGVSVNSLEWGGAAVLTPNQESVKSMQVASADYSAEAGRNSGAQIRVVSQNGTNQFHGSGVFKYNDPIFNAYNKFGGPDNAPPIRANQYLRQFAGSFGGPIVRNKLFFFASYEGLRQNSTNYTTTWVTTPEFNQAVIAARPGSNIAQVLNNPAVQPLVTGYIPTPCPKGFAPGICQQVSGGLNIGSLTGARGQYVDFANDPTGAGLTSLPEIAFAQIRLPGTLSGNQYNGRLDFTPTANDSFAVSAYITKLNMVSADPTSGAEPIGDLPFRPLNSSATVTYNRVLSATFLNEARFNVSRFADNGVADAANVNFGIPRIEVEGLALPARLEFGAPQGNTTPSLQAQNQYEFRDTISKVLGAHTLKAGVDVRWEQNNDNLVGGARPDYSFQGLFNLANDTPVFEGINVNPATGAANGAQRYFRTRTYAAFLQDQWKIRPNLTITMGLRWEYFSPLTEERGQLSNLFFNTPGTLANATIQPVSELYSPDRHNFGPRFGFAYNPDRLKNLVIRGGFGTYFQRVPDVLFTNNDTNPPFFASLGICCGNVQSPFDGNKILYSLGSSNSIYSYPMNPALAVGINPATGGLAGSAVQVWGAERNFPTGYAEIYSLNLEYRLPWQLVASFGYQGSVDHHLIRIVNENFLYPNSPAFGPVYFPQPDGNSEYNSLNLTLSRAFSNGLGLQANYRWSKSIDTLSNEGPGASANQTYPQNQATERGLSDFDTPQYLTVAGQYELPWYKNSTSGWQGKLLGGWAVTPILTYHSGFPYTVKIGQSVSSPGGPTLGPIRPTAYYGNAVYSSSNSALINGTNWPGGGATYFDIKDGGAPGIGRNTFRGPRYFGTDLAVSKTIRLPETRYLGQNATINLRGNLYNLFNTLNLTPFGFYDPGAFADSGQFGRATEPGLAGRVVEFQARLSF